MSKIHSHIKTNQVSGENMDGMLSQEEINALLESIIDIKEEKPVFTMRKLLRLYQKETQ